MNTDAPGSAPGRPLLWRLAHSVVARRWAFWTYALGIFVLTHWPRLEVPSIGIERTDILVHMAVFGTWAVLLLATGYLGPFWKTSTILKMGGVALVYAAFDEATQALPFVQRHAAMDDFGANVLGILAACLVALAIAAIARRRKPFEQQSGS